MVRLWKLPAALVELSIGTTILLVHLGLAARYERRLRLGQGRALRPGG